MGWFLPFVIGYMVGDSSSPSPREREQQVIEIKEKVEKKLSQFVVIKIPKEKSVQLISEAFLKEFEEQGMNIDAEEDIVDYVEEQTIAIKNFKTVTVITIEVYDENYMPQVEAMLFLDNLLEIENNLLKQLKIKKGGKKNG